MSRSKLIAFIALITLAFAVTLVADALAGEKAKGRTVGYITNWQSVKVPDREGHIIGFWEGKGVQTVFSGNPFSDGALYNEVGYLDLLDAKTGQRVHHGYYELICRDGDKIYSRYEITSVSQGVLYGTWEHLYGTGRYEGIKGKGTFVSHPSGDRWYSDWEGEVELPKK